MPNRVMIFIDGSNFYHNLKGFLGRADLDYYRFSQKLVNGRQLVRTYYYNCPLNQKSDPEGYKQQQRFFAALNNTDYLEVILGRLQRKNDGRAIEKGVDVKLAVHVLHKAYLNQYDVAILVSGDADFAEAAQFVKDMGKHIELASFPSQKCYHLRKVADKTILLDNSFLADCWIKKLTPNLLG